MQRDKICLLLPYPSILSLALRAFFASFSFQRIAMAPPSFRTLLLLVLLALANLASSQTNQFFPENGKGFLSAGCTDWIIRGADYDFALEAEWYNFPSYRL